MPLAITTPTQAEKDAALIGELLRRQWDDGRLPWVNAADIVCALWPELAGARLEDGKRKVRKAVETTMQIVSAPGSHGYALRVRVPPAQEVEVCNARLSQARKNFRKAWRARKEALRRMTPDFSLEGPATGQPAPTPEHRRDEEVAQALSAYFTGEEHA